MSAFAILDRRAEVRRKNLSKSRHRLNELAKEKEKKQYDSYISNVNTLNQMKQIFADFYPTLTEKETQEGEESLTVTPSASKTRDASKRTNGRKAPNASFAAKKRKMVRCIVNYERELRNYEAAWQTQPVDTMNTTTVAKAQRMRSQRTTNLQTQAQGRNEQMDGVGGRFSWHNSSIKSTQRGAHGGRDRYGQFENA